MRRRSGQALFLTGTVAEKRCAALAKEKEEELKSRFLPEMIEYIAGFPGREASRKAAAAAASFPGAEPLAKAAGKDPEPEYTGTVYLDLEKGFRSALWNLAQAYQAGLEIDMKKVPVRQETIEICNYFDMDPYEEPSGDCLLIVTDNRTALLDAFRKEDIPIAEIGYLTQGPARILRTKDRVRYLDRAEA